MIRVLVLALLVIGCAASTRKQQIDEMLLGYDRTQRPLWNTSVGVTVNVSLTMVSLYNIDARSSTFEIALYLRQRWIDERLDAPDMFEYGTLDSVRIGCERLWVPDVFAQNAVETTELVRPSCKLYEDGLLLYARKVVLRMRTTYHLREFPFDQQLLPVELLSFSYGSDELILEVEEEGQLWSPPPRMDSSVFSIARSGLSDRSEVVLRPRDGPHWRLVGSITIERQWNNFAIKIIIPLALLVTLSQLMYYVDLRAAPARVGGAVTLLLTTSTFNLIASTDVPRINYSTVLDIFVLTAFAFALLGCCEYVLASYLLNRVSYAAAFRLEYWCRLTLAPAWILSIFAILVPGLWPEIVFPLLIVAYAVLTAIITHVRVNAWDRRRRLKEAAAAADSGWHASAVPIKKA